MKHLLREVLQRANQYLVGLDKRSVAPSLDAVNRLSKLYKPLPDESTEPEDVLALLDDIGSPATVGSAGARYFGFVTGGSLPVALAANWLAGAWDQNSFCVASSPIAVALEEIALRWLIDVLDLPPDCGGSFVTGATMANFTALAAARHAVLEKAGWDVEAEGLFGATPISVVVGEEVHPTLLKTLGFLGLGRNRVATVSVDGQGRMRIDSLPPLSDTTIVCVQVGNVNTGAFDPVKEICAIAHDSGAWVHVDGAFGLWAAATPERAYLTSGVANADSWATDMHKWLNVPYDSGMAFVRNPEILRAAMSLSAAYLPEGNKREPLQYTPETSRRARGAEVWAALLSLGRTGLADLIERTCRYASRFSEGLSAAGYQVLNDVVINQVLVSFGDDETTRKIIAEIQTDGTCWCGGTVWQDHVAMRISVSSWATTEEDVEQSLSAILRVAADHRA